MKIDVSRIVVAHVRTLRDFSDGRKSALDIALFFGLPAVIAGAAWYLALRLHTDALNALLTAFSIFAGLLLNLLILVYTFATQAQYPSALAKVRSTLTKELHDNLAYSIFLSLVLVVVTMTAVTVVKNRQENFAGLWLSSLIIYLTTNFVLTLLMILKRIYIMLNRELADAASRKSA